MEPERHFIPREDVRQLIASALDHAIRDQRLPGDALTAAGIEHPPIELSHPANPDHGDLATNLALQLARPMRLPPREIAAILAAELTAAAEAPFSPIVSAETAGPGFVNLRLASGYLEAGLDHVRAQGGQFGQVRTATPQRINVEFVSANPTGPLTVGNARGAFVGDLLCRVLTGAGHDVTREYYFNDSGGQVTNLGASVAAQRLGEPIPEDGYRGDYVADLARRVPPEVWQEAEADPEQRGAILGRWASEQVRAGIEASLERLGVAFDVWKSEGSLHAEGWVERATGQLAASDAIYEQDGARWFRSTAYGDDKDRVVYRADGRPTYFAADIGYVAEKFSRGFDHLVYIWGADHHGTVARVRNAAQALGFDPAALEIILTAWVRFIRDGVEISMSKRAGEFITLDELLQEVGVDAARWYFASRAPSTGIDFDIELAKRQSNENPVYYVQYAHARIASILRKAAESDLRPAATLIGSLSDDPVALGLAKSVLRLPEVVADAAAQRETQGVTTFATDLASTFHAFYRDRRVVDVAQPDLSAARLALVDATRIALANALELLGISAPDSM